MGQKNRFFSLFSRNRKNAASGDEREEKRREPEEKKKFRLKDLDPDEGYLKEEPEETKNKPSDTMSDLIETVEDWNDTEKKRELGTEDTSGSLPSAGNDAPADGNPAENDQISEVEPKDAFAIRYFSLQKERRPLTEPTEKSRTIFPGTRRSSLPPKKMTASILKAQTTSTM